MESSSVRPPPPSPSARNGGGQVDKVKKHCIILAAGIASPPIAPYTQQMPKCFLPIAGEPIINHILRMFVNQGIKHFTIVIGAHANYFSPEVRQELMHLVGSTASKSAADASVSEVDTEQDETPSSRGGSEMQKRNSAGLRSASLLEKNSCSLLFVENNLFWNNGPADSLRLGYESLMRKEKEKPTPAAGHLVYVCYGDTVFTDVALQKLVAFPAPNALLIDRSITIGGGAVESPGLPGNNGSSPLSVQQPSFSSSRAQMHLRGAKSRETGLQELELCSVTPFPKHNSWNLVDQIGKNLIQRGMTAFGEFTGLFRATNETMDQAFGVGDNSEAPAAAASCFYVPDVLRKCILEYQTEFFAVPIFGNRREIHSSQDLLQANSELCYLSDQVGRKEYIKAIGSRLLAEANDLKRPVEIIAQELNFPDTLLDDLLNGNVELETAQEILRKVNTNYPVSLNALWVEPDDCFNGIRICRAKESEVSKRILHRINGRTNKKTPYYEYRDCAMSRLGPFRPEWIKELRIVSDSDPENPEVAFNNGHLLFQSTFFIGPVNFYYSEPDGTKRCVEMNTGDSNWIAPFVPHSFTSRDGSKFACIIACTYGSGIVGCLQSIGGLHHSDEQGETQTTSSTFGGTNELLNKTHLNTYSGDLRDPLSHFQANLLRYAQNDGFPNLKEFADRLMMQSDEKGEGTEPELSQTGANKESGAPANFTSAIAEQTRRLCAEVLGVKRSELASKFDPESRTTTAATAGTRLPTIEECRLLAKELHCLPEDLYVERGLEEPVVVSFRGKGALRTWSRTLKLERLASSEHHSMIKSFDVEICDGDSVLAAESSCEEDWIQIAVHNFGYNYSEKAFLLETFREKTVINPGDSFYVQPHIRHRFQLLHAQTPRTTVETMLNGDQSTGNGASPPASARMYLVRIPGALTRELMREVALCDQRGKARIGNESRRWYN
ncbi:unnamed protein product [Amoebophrya sp. A120]|nr:unnamed protein product [Amoebophrya sp. A120]|eukprot:GSA120T00003954001.1